jgi:hypothetical protein
MPNFKGIQPVGDALIHADKRADGHDKAKTLYTTTRTLLKIPRSAHTVYLCVLCGSQNKQRLFPYTALTD